ncbi:MAG TPA: amidohydrolase [Syntrophorhabdaceae bacterium]|nr:amidohydrolase [Syntrophorhabdaceae bacterium]HNT67804.1 amidohydrolase [Syntrophorhabdaceae bacterium]
MKNQGRMLSGRSATAKIIEASAKYPPKADLALIGGKVICVDEKNTQAQAVAAKDGKIIAIGADKAIQRFIGPKTRVIELRGRTVLPALIDSHAHLYEWASNLAQVDLREARSADAVLTLIRKRAAQTKAGEWVQAYGLSYDLLSHGVVKMDRYKLDKVSRSNPVIILSVGHFLLFNSAALKRFDVTRDTPDPDKEIWKDASGEPIGVMAELKWSEYKNKVPPLTFDEHVDYLEKAVAIASSLGIGTMEDSNSYKETVKAYKKLLDEGRLKVRININPIIDKDTAKYYMETGLGSGFGNEWMRFGQTKIMLGTMGARTATMLKDYADEPGHKGAPVYPIKTIEKFVMDSVKNGWSCQIHVMGDGDLEIVLNAYEKALKWYRDSTGKDNRDLRLTIDHYGLYTPAQLKRTADMKIWVSAQPIHRSMWNRPDGFFMTRIGKERWTRCVPIGTLFQAGIPVSFGSDINYAVSMDPRIGIYTCLDGMGQPGEVISAYQVIQGYTINAARRLFRDHEAGSIEVGKLADFVVLNMNPLEVPKEKIWNDSKNAPSDLEVEFTIVGGEVTYSKNDI